MTITWSPDYACMVHILNTPPVTADCSCTVCWVTKEDMRKPDTPPAAPRHLEGYQTECSEFLGLFDDINDFPYDVEHDVSLTMSDAVVHALTLWTRRNLTSQWVDKVDAVWQKHLSRHPYYAPLTEGIGRRDWRMSNQMTKDIVGSDAFWRDLANALPHTRDGLRIRSPVIDDNEVLLDPLQEYVFVMKRLARQLLSWAPTNVADRDSWCLRARQLYFAIGLPDRRFSMAVHWFFCHYTPRLLKHGNLMCMCSEGGEHMHQPHSAIVERRPSCPRYKCPVGLEECMKDARLRLAIWRQGWIFPSTAFAAPLMLLPGKPPPPLPRFCTTLWLHVCANKVRFSPALL